MPANIIWNFLKRPFSNPLGFFVSLLILVFFTLPNIERTGFGAGEGIFTFVFTVQLVTVLTFFFLLYKIIEKLKGQNEKTIVKNSFSDFNSKGLSFTLAAVLVVFVFWLVAALAQHYPIISLGFASLISLIAALWVLGKIGPLNLGGFIGNFANSIIVVFGAFGFAYLGLAVFAAVWLNIFFAVHGILAFFMLEQQSFNISLKISIVLFFALIAILVLLYRNKKRVKIE